MPKKSPSTIKKSRIDRVGRHTDFPPICDIAVGIDIHKDSAVACVLGAPGDKEHFEIQSYGTFRKDIEELGQWLQLKIKPDIVAMESTSVYWMPTYSILTALGLNVIIVNAFHVKNLKGRKSDIEDSRHLAMVARAGLVRASRIMSRDDNDIREISRYRVKLNQQANSHKNRILKLLEKSGFKLAKVMSDVFGKSGMIILSGLLGGSSPDEIVNILTRTMGYRLKTPRARLIDALSSPMTSKLHYSLEGAISTYNSLQGQANEYERTLEDALKDRGDLHKIELLMTMPGVSATSAMTLLAELGSNLSSFPSAEALSSWAGICPGNNQSAGKHGPTSIRKGNAQIKRILCEMANAAVKSECYFKSKFQNLRMRRGHRRAVIAIGHQMLKIIYHMITKDVPYHDSLANYEELLAKKNAPRWIKSLKKYNLVTNIE